MARKSFFLKACQTVEENKKSYAEKAQETKKHQSRLPEMQIYVDLSKEKRLLLLDLILNGKSSDSDETLLHKGVVVYIKHPEVIKQVSQDLTLAGVEHFIIQGKTKRSKRGEIEAEFKGNPESRVVIVSNAGAESLNLHSTNEIILYNCPDGPGKFVQTIGRVARNFSHFEDEGRSFYIHYIIVKGTIDEYKPILLSSKKQLEEEILHADTISLKGQGSFDGMLLKKIRKDMLWKEKEKRKQEKKSK